MNTTGPGPTEPCDVVVLLNSRWRGLAWHNTRWRAVVLNWATNPRVGKLTVVDYPTFSRRALLRRTRGLIGHCPTWRPDVEALSLTVPAGVRPGPFDRRAWRAAAAALRARVAPPGRPPPVVVVTTPLWGPIVEHLGGLRRAFDAVDDWRGLASARASARRVELGYRALAAADVATANSEVLAQRLAQDYGIRAEPVPNGVDVDAYRDPPPFEGPLPDGPFAVYVGTIEARVDLDLLLRVADAVPVVVAGPAPGELADRLRASKAAWVGPVAAEAVPGLLTKATVGLIPHHVDPFTTSMDPMKLLEYLAAGLTVVSTPLPNVEELSRHVRVAGTTDDFVAETGRALARKRRRQPDRAVVGRDWDAVANRLLDVYLSGGQGK